MYWKESLLSGFMGNIVLNQIPPIQPIGQITVDLVLKAIVSFLSVIPAILTLYDRRKRRIKR